MPRNSEELMRTALRVLGAYTSREHPDSTDVQALRAAAPEPECHWEADLLAGYLVQRELQKKQRVRAAS